MAAPVFAAVDSERIAPVGRGHGGAQPVGSAGHQDQVDMVGHEAPGPDRRAGLQAVTAQEPEVGAIVVEREEDRLAAAAALGDMMRNARDD